MVPFPRFLLEVQYAKIGIVKRKADSSWLRLSIFAWSKDIFLGLHTQISEHDHTAIRLREGEIGETLQ